jgi:hypothetical protein
MASPALVSKIKSFAAKIGGSTSYDMTKDPTSAVSMMQRKQKSTPVPTSQNARMGSKQQTFGVPGAK